MLKKLRRRFIIAVMLAVVAVLLLFAAGLCLWNHASMTAELDRMLDGIAVAEQREAPEAAPNGFPITGAFEIGPNETEYTTRFFAVHLNDNGGSRTMDFISAVTEEEADEYAAEALATGRERGWLGIYRFLTVKGEDDTIVIFLNASAQQGFGSSLLQGALIITVSASVMIFLLVLLFSTRAIRPYMRNMEQQKRFITDAGHELKTPLTSIATSAEVLAMEVGEDDEWIGNIRSQTGRMTKLVNDLVALSRMNEELPFPEMTEFSLTDAAWETAEPFTALAGARGKELRCRIRDGLTLRGDRESVQRLISILLDNAVKYALPDGGISLTVDSLHGRRRIMVENRCSLPKDFDTARLFERFYRPDASRTSSTGGTGVGLAMARAIAEAHHGCIRAERPDRDTIRFIAML